MRVKVVGTERSVSTANTIDNATMVRFFNNTGAAVVVTRANTGGTIGSASIISGSVEIFEKEPTDTFAAGAAILGAPVAYT